LRKEKKGPAVHRLDALSLDRCTAVALKCRSKKL